MSDAVSDLAALLCTMEPVLHDGVYVYSSVAEHELASVTGWIALLREAEGISLIVPEADAARLGLAVFYRAAWITLTVHSDLAAVGLTAAVATALSDAGISCNVVAGAYHDHLFVPEERAADAMSALRSLQQQSSRELGR